MKKRSIDSEENLFGLLNLYGEENWSFVEREKSVAPQKFMLENIENNVFYSIEYTFRSALQYTVYRYFSDGILNIGGP